jgi:uncharacterized membrane protein required for colicin V production
LNLFDWILILLLIGALIQGYQRGLVLQLASLITYFASLWVAYKFTDELAPELSKLWQMPESVQSGWLSLFPMEKMIYSAMAFFLLFVGTKLVLSILVSVINQVAKLPVLSLFNRSGGVLFAFVKTLVVIVVVVNILHVLPWAPGQNAVKSSALAQTCLHMTPDLTKEVKDLLHGSNQA